VTGPAWVGCLAMPGVLAPWGEAYARELAAHLLSHMAENNWSAGSFPPKKAFLGFSSGKGSGLVAPFADTNFALSQSLWAWICFTVL